jgi:hypothetical protein
MADEAKPGAVARHWKKCLAGALVTLLGMLLQRYGLAPSDPAPAPIVAPVKAADPFEPHAPRRTYGWTFPAPGEIPERVFSAPAGMVGELPEALHLMAPAASLPAPAGLPYDQGELGSCGPCSAAALLLFTEARAGRRGLPPPSRLFIYYNAREVMGTVSRDSGVSNAAMFRGLTRYGFCDESLVPYQIQRFQFRPDRSAYDQAARRKVTTVESVPQQLDQMRACLAAGRPFVFGFTVFPSLETPAVESTGAVSMPGPWERPIGGHDVLIVGYDDTRGAFRFLNSWGREWGDGGFGWMPYSYALNAKLAGDFWTVRASGR